MEGKALVEDLKRLVYNASLYSQKSSSLKGDTLWIQGAAGLRVVSTDDWIILTDSCLFEGPSRVSWTLLKAEELKALGNELKRAEGVDYDLSLFPGQVLDPKTAASVDLLLADQMVYEPDVGAKPALMEAVAIHPDRLRKLSLIKPGGYPIDLKGFEDAEGELIVAFRVGPTVRGLIAPLDRQKQLEKYTGEEVWR